MQTTPTEQPLEKNYSGITRREAIGVGAAALGALALEADAAAAKTSTAGSRAPRRSEIYFDEGWRFLLGDITGAEQPSFDDSGWRALDVPHDWRIEDLPNPTATDGGATANPSGMAFVTNPSPDGTPPQRIGPFDQNADTTPNGAGNNGRNQGYTPSGIGWYRKHFRLPAATGRALRSGHGRVQLRLDGVSGYTDIYLNGAHLAFHAHGYTSFGVDLTAHLKPSGVNVLAMRVDDTGATSRWYAGNGIYRHTWLTTTGPVSIPLWGMYVTTPSVSARRAVIRTQVEVQNELSRAPVRVRVTLRDPRGRVVARHTTAPAAIAHGATHTFDLRLAVDDPKLWSPDSPSLYSARAEVLKAGRAVDGVSSRFGIRTIQWDGSHGFRLNGKPTKILGGCIHASHGPLGAVALDRSEYRRVELLKQAGFNAIRTAHNPPTPSLLDACDQLGMLVWDEFTDVWGTGKNAEDYHLYFPKLWRQDLTDMIRRDRNHPSVIIWSIGNEISEDSSYATQGAQMAALVRSFDSTRPVTTGGPGPGSGQTSPSDAAYDWGDVCDVHYQTDNTGIHNAHPAKAVTQSESYPTTIYADWKFAQDNPWMAGSWVWAAWDYIGEAGCGATPIGPTAAVGEIYAYGAVLGSIPYPWFQDFQGDLDLIGQPKPQNRWRKVIYGLSNLELLVERPPPPGMQQYASAWGYYDELECWNWDVLPTQQMTIHAYTSGDTVKLLLNGSEVATNTVADSDGRVTTFTLPYSPGTLTAVAYRGGREIARRSLTTTGTPAALRLTSDVGSLTTSRDDLAHVLVEVLDAKGRRVADAVVKVEFGIAGAGALAGVGNGNPHNVDSFQQPRRYTWHGQAIAILRPAKHTGRLTISASASGLKGATLTLPVRTPRKAPRLRSPPH